MKSLSRSVIRVIQPLLECAILSIAAAVFTPVALLYAFMRLLSPARSGAIAKPRSVAITGAASGIGASLAARYAAPGVLLFLADINEDLLKKVAEDCISRGADVRSTRLDISEGSAVKKWIEGADAERPLDIVYANAGTIVSHTRDRLPKGATDAEVAVALHSVNILGTAATAYNALDCMKPRGRGQIVVVGSVSADYRNAGTYAVSKAAVRSLALTLHKYAASHGVAVTLVEPAFVVTQISKTLMSLGWRLPMLMGVEDATAIIVEGVEHADAQITFPLAMYLNMRFIGCLPVPLWSMLPSKKAEL